MTDPVRWSRRLDPSPWPAGSVGGREHWPASPAGLTDPILTLPGENLTRIRANLLSGNLGQNRAWLGKRR
jgi:hypothetical protein